MAEVWMEVRGRSEAGPGMELERMNRTGAGRGGGGMEFGKFPSMNDTILNY